MSNNPVDFNVLSTLRDVMEAEYPALLKVFISDSTLRVNDMTLLLRDPTFTTSATASLQRLGLMAHSFKGSTGNMGATYLSELCLQLEEQGRGMVTADDAQIRSLVSQIRDEFYMVRAIFERELERCHANH
ncbi:Hpt domain-containing protein [Pseudomonas graminis]|uniref:Hpt domain-containing protein n=1 Tax=Pseudomonas graminis TaxID=158627 RepID=UPI00234BC046|nr:Hpt domain-containing protein [Pseudomonas graminis]MDC6383212.1 Hpt domain-containing protein [Pseudomonas graminis]